MIFLQVDIYLIFSKDYVAIIDINFIDIFLISSKEMHSDSIGIELSFILDMKA